MYKYDPGLEESYCIKPIWLGGNGGKWCWCVYLKVEKPRGAHYIGHYNGENFKGDPEDADYVWVPRGPGYTDEGDTYEQALAYLRKEYIEPRIEMKRLANVIIHAPFPDTVEL